MATRVIGVAMVVGVLGFVGVAKGQSFTQRTRCLRNMRMALDHLEKEICFGRVPLARAWAEVGKVADWPVNMFFLMAHRRLVQEKTATALEAWQEGIRFLERNSHLCREDLEIIKSLGERLGVSDVVDQARVLALVKAELKVQEEKAKSNEESGKKLWSYGGFLAGILVSILLL